MLWGLTRGLAAFVCPLALPVTAVPFRLAACPATAMLAAECMSAKLDRRGPASRKSGGLCWIN